MEKNVIDNGQRCFLFYKDNLLCKVINDRQMDVPWVGEVDALGFAAADQGLQHTDGNGRRVEVVVQDGTLHYTQQLFHPTGNHQPIPTGNQPNSQQGNQPNSQQGNQSNSQQGNQLSEPPVLPEGWQWVGLRASFDVLPLPLYLQAGKASQILYWDSHSRFCPACGTATEQINAITKRCPACRYELYPPIATAIIVLVKRGEDELLLVHARNFRGNFKGLVAGFLEAGETLEQCVAREVMEETGLRIDHIRYVDSQSWPYPSGLMVGFVADYVSGQIKMQEEELSTAAFYHRDRLPEIPRKVSIARRLIDLWIERKI